MSKRECNSTSSVQSGDAEDRGQEMFLLAGEKEVQLVMSHIVMKLEIISIFKGHGIHHHCAVVHKGGWMCLGFFFILMPCRFCYLNVLENKNQMAYCLSTAVMRI